jgi:hypothetical protein
MNAKTCSAVLGRRNLRRRDGIIAFSTAQTDTFYDNDTGGRKYKGKVVVGEPSIAKETVSSQDLGCYVVRVYDSNSIRAIRHRD